MRRWVTPTNEAALALVGVQTRGIECVFLGRGPRGVQPQVASLPGGGATLGVREVGACDVTAGASWRRQSAQDRKSEVQRKAFGCRARWLLSGPYCTIPEATLNTYLRGARCKGALGPSPLPARDGRYVVTQTDRRGDGPWDGSDWRA